MGKIESFEELEFTAKDQLKRAALSSMNNIAEGFGRFSTKESIRFLNISTASLDEVHSMLLLYSELGYVKLDQKNETLEILKKAKHQTLGFIKYLNTKL